MAEAPKKPTIEDFMDGGKDYGKEPASVTFTEADRELIATIMASQAAYTKLVLEGVIPFGEELHYQIHFQEYVNQLMEGKDINLPGVAQTLRVDSVGGELYLETLRNAFKHGQATANSVREKMKEAFEQHVKMSARVSNTEDEEQTNKEANDDLSPNRTIN